MQMKSEFRVSDVHVNVHERLRTVQKTSDNTLYEVSYTYMISLCFGYESQCKILLYPLTYVCKLKR